MRAFACFRGGFCHDLHLEQSQQRKRLLVFHVSCHQGFESGKDSLNLSLGYPCFGGKVGGELASAVGFFNGGQFSGRGYRFFSFWAALMWTAGFFAADFTAIDGVSWRGYAGTKGQDSKAYVSDSGFATGKRHIQALAAFLA